MYTYKDEFEVEKSTHFFFSKQEWGKFVTWMYTWIYDFYQNSSWNKCEEKMKSMWKKKLEVISFYIQIDLMLITMENIPPILIYELVQSMVPLLWSHICLFKLSHHDYVVVHHLCKHIKGLVMEIQTLNIWLWNFGLWSRCSPHDLINLCRLEGWVSQNHCQCHHMFHYNLTLMLSFVHLFIKFACILSFWNVSLSCL